MAKNVTTMPQKNQQVSKMIDPIEKTTKGVRQVLFEEMEAMRNGKSSPTRANAMTKLAMSIVESMRLEMQHESHRAKFPLLDGQTEESKIVTLGDED